MISISGVPTRPFQGLRSLFQYHNGTGGRLGNNQNDGNMQTDPNTTNIADINTEEYDNEENTLYSMLEDNDDHLWNLQFLGGMIVRIEDYSHESPTAIMPDEDPDAYETRILQYTGVTEQGIKDMEIYIQQILAN